MWFDERGGEMTIGIGKKDDDDVESGGKVSRKASAAAEHLAGSIRRKTTRPVTVNKHRRGEDKIKGLVNYIDKGRRGNRDRCRPVLYNQIFTSFSLSLFLTW